ncbi:CBS domain-containing protein [Pseudanabaena sp. Chao 1811]|uniref:CBS domain-containing protein n=1 Tax=Pseudanabaena sp. Chao 1811 TaxID=2963092 RepID=UPI0022F3EFED|nr:CBS domain-containing protein [Pseudanabaena sp. Chao 1811]
MHTNSSSLNSFFSIDLAIDKYPLKVEPSTLVLDAIAFMGLSRSKCSLEETDCNRLNLLESRASCVIVIEDDQLVGIFTERDVVRLLANDVKLENIHIESVMTRSPIVLKRSQCRDIFAFVNLFQKHHIRHLPIVDDQGKFVGLVTQDSVRRNLQPVDLLRARSIAEIMSKQVVWALPSETITDLALKMTNHRVSCVVIIEDRRPIGIVTERDIVQFQALKLSLDAIEAHLVMSSPLFCLQPEQTLWIAHQEMQRRNIQRLVVTDNSGDLVGIVTQTSLLEVLQPKELYSVVEALQRQVARLESEKVQILEERNQELEKKVEARTAEVSTKLEREYLIASVSNQIRYALSIDSVLQTIVHGLRKLLKCDRVLIYQFQSSRKGIIISEDCANQEMSIINHQFSDTCFYNESSAESFKDDIRAINDIYTADLASCHVQLLERYSVKASVIVPISVNGKEQEVIPYLPGVFYKPQLLNEGFWGLLIAHQCDAPRSWKSGDLELLDQLSSQISISLQQTLAQAQNQAELLERKRAEAALKDSEELFRQLAENIQQVFYLTDIKNSSILYVSPSYENIWGKSCQSLYDNPRSYIESVYPSDREIVINAHQRKLLGENTAVEYRIIRPDGQVRWIFDRTFTIRDRNGEVYRVSGIADDISDRKNAELNLKQLNQELESRVAERTHDLQSQLAAIEASTDGIAIINEQGEYTFINAAHLEIFGCQDAGEVIGKTWKVFYYPEEIERMEKEVFPIIEANQKWRGEAIAKRRDGSTFVEELSLTMVKGIGLICVCRDGTERKQMEESIRQALAKEQELSELRSSFISIASHEFRTPLTVISSSSVILETYSDRLSEEKKKIHLQRINSSVNHMVHLLDDVLTINRAEANKLEFKPKTVDLVSFCQNLIAELQITTTKHKLIFAVLQNNEIEPTLTSLDAYCDIKLLRQILTNLLSNAIKYSPQGGIVHLRLTQQDKNLTLQIQDSGIGIPIDSQSQLFSSFYRAENVGNISGTGLGLSIVKKCVDLHNGLITIDSQEGKGTTFNVTIPFLLG